MNRARVAAALRELAAAIEADDAEDAPASTSAKPRPAQKRTREAKTLTRPADVTDLDIQRARDAARRAGIVLDQ